MTIEKIKAALEAVNCSPEAIEWVVGQITDRDNGWKFKRRVGSVLFNYVRWGESPNFAPDIYQHAPFYWVEANQELERRKL